MSHHYSGPDVSSPHGDARLDLSDPYAFPKPGSAALGPKAVGLWARTLDWRARAAAVHAAFVARRLSPGGCADLLAMTLFVDAPESEAVPR